MKLKAEMGHYSSVVCYSVHLIGPEGHFAGQVAILCQDDRLRDRETQEALLQTICDAINAKGTPA